MRQEPIPPTPESIAEALRDLLNFVSDNPKEQVPDELLTRCRELVG